MIKPPPGFSTALPVLAAASLMLAACASGPSQVAATIPGPTVTRATANGPAQVNVHLPSGTLSGYRTQVVPYTRASIHHLVIQVYQFDSYGQEVPFLDANGNPLTATLVNSELDSAVTFTGLWFGTPYRIRCSAYSGTASNDSDLISVKESSYLDLTLADGVTSTTITLNVRLKDVPGAGDVNSGNIVITDGSVTASGSASAGSKPYVVSTYAGSGAVALTDGIGTNAAFNNPIGLAIDSANTVYVSDTSNNAIRKINATNGMVSTMPLSIPASESALYSPRDLLLAPGGMLYVANTLGDRIQTIAPDGTVKTVAGNGTDGYQDGAAGIAEFASPSGIALAPSGDLYIADTYNQRIRMLRTDNQVITVAGGDATGSVDAQGASARFYNPKGVVVAPDGTIFVADTGNNTIRKITTDGTVITWAGSGTVGLVDGHGTDAQFKAPTHLSLDVYGNLLVADTGNNAIRKISVSGYVSTIGGTGNLGNIDATASAATFGHPTSVVSDPLGNLFIADSGNNLIRVMRR